MTLDCVQEQGKIILEIIGNDWVSHKSKICAPIKACCDDWTGSRRKTDKI